MGKLIVGGVVDEYRLFVYPVVLGRGRRLFADAIGLPGLRLAGARPFRSGIVLLRYPHPGPPGPCLNDGSPAVNAQGPGAAGEEGTGACGSD